MRPRTLSCWLLIPALVVCYAIYLVQVFGPLRISSDSIEYLSIAASAMDGKGFRFLGNPTQHPPGYPAMIAMLELMRMARPWGLVGLNCALLLVGLVATYVIARKAIALSREGSLFACLLTLLSFIIIKHAALALSDIPYFG